MGCDVHMFIEHRENPDQPWKSDPGHSTFIEDGDVYVHAVSATNRNYELFGILASVRSNGCIYPQRGLPDDVSPLVKQESDRWDSDAHSHSWLTLQEFKICLAAAKYDWTKEKCSTAFYEWQSFKSYKDRPPDYTPIVWRCEEYIDSVLGENVLLGTQHRPETRIVFWFDN